MNVIKTQALEKTYGAKRAVDHFDMHVKQGDIYGFVGRNGAGKSTVMKLISGLAHPTGGEIELFGKRTTNTDIRDRIGVLIENPGLYPHTNAFDNLMLKALCLGVPDPKKQSMRLLEYVGLAEVAKKNTSQFSMGMKQRLGLALALMGDPDLLLLDEPLNGLDPEGAREIRQLLTDLNEEKGVTILISSHILDQLGKMATRYGVIREGNMVRELSVAEVEEECQDYIEVKVADPALALAVLQENIPQAKFVAMPDGALQVYGIADAAPIAESLSAKGIAVYGLHMHKRDLEEFFVGLMGDDRNV